ncbi:MAG: PilZ domain-containing protein [Kiloniellaceae bacterium]
MSASQAFQGPHSTERRNANRVAVGDRTPLTATAGGRIYTCYIEDISATGLKLRFEGRMPEGKVIAVDHSVAGTLCGRCAWREDDTMGVELQVPSSDLERVLRCICLVL